MKLNFTLTQLEYVLAVQRHGHFSKAAEACHITQPTLSMQIQKLEEELGAPLFDRTKKPILLTALGTRLIAQMQAVLTEAKKIEGLVQKGSSNRLEGELTLGVIPTVAPYVIPRVLPTLQRELPGLRLKIREMQTHRIVEALQIDEIDVGLLATPLESARLYELALFYEPFSLLCQKKGEFGSRQTIQYGELRSALEEQKLGRLWLLEEGHCLRHQVVDLCSLRKRGAPPRKARALDPKTPEGGSQRPLGKDLEQFEFESGSLETLKNLVETLGGCTLLPALAKEGVGPHCRLIEFERPIPAREVGLVYLREHHKVDLIEGLGETILKALPEELRRIRKKDLEVLPVEERAQR